MVLGIKQALKFPLSLKIRRDLVNASHSTRNVGNVCSVWRKRIDDVKSCPHNNSIRRVDGAGELNGAFLRMHNGVRVSAQGYYGSGILNMLIENRGVHEPHEERAFEEILNYLPDNPVMLELGAYWGFYSLSMLNRHPAGKCFLVEPCPIRIQSGKLNFQENQRAGDFEQAYVGDTDRWSLLNGRTISVDGFCKRKQIRHLNILHADIQGHEVQMLQGAQGMLKAGRIDYIFISTHSNELHRDCQEILSQSGFIILASSDKTETHSFDGLIVAKKRTISGPATLFS
jgi:hypothetical protein